MAFFAALPFIVLISLVVSKWRAGLSEKLGFIKFSKDILSNKNIWVHAVSYGEVKTVEPLIYELQKAFPEYNLCLSTGTQTGQNLAKSLFSHNSNNSKLLKNIFVFYCPFDFYFSVKSLMNKLNPKMLIVAETEIWPEMLAQAKQKAIPTFLVNARLTNRSVNRYKFLKPIFGQVLKTFTGIYTQSERDKIRFLEIGALSERMKVLPNLKFDSMQKAQPEKVDELKQELNIKANSIVLIAGSTHKGEEELICKLFSSLLSHFHNKNLNLDLRLILAPRHLDRVHEVESICKNHKLIFRKRSQNNAREFEAGQALLLDTMGELSQMYAVSDIALLGGTWAKIGGHNPLEAAVNNIPILVGEHIYKISDLADQLAELGLLFQTISDESLFTKTLELIQNENNNDNSSQPKAKIELDKSVSSSIIELIKQSTDF